MARIFLAFLLFLMPLWVFGQEDVLRDKSDEWRVLVTDLISSPHSGSSSGVSTTLSSTAARHFSAFRTHLMSDKEAESMRNFLKEEYIIKCRKELSGYYKKYDELLFSESADNSSEKSALNNIRKGKKKLKKAERYKTERIYIEKEKEIVLLNQDEKEDTELKSPADLYTEAVSRKLDYIIWGTVTVVEDTAATEISLYSRLENRNVHSIRVTDSLDRIYDSVARALDSFNGFMLGTDWARISLNLNDPDADIYVDGEYKATGSSTDIIVEPGVHKVTVFGAGTDIAEREISLDSGGVLELDMEVSPKPGRHVVISSDPPGADIYYRSVWQGKTPMVIEGDEGEVVISKEGYLSSRGFLEDAEGNSLEFYPQKELFDRDGYLLEKRNDFYKNLTFFVLSIPVAFFSYANYQSYDDLYKRSVASGSSHEQRKNKRIRNYSRGMYYGSLFLSVTLFVNAMFHLKDYIRTGEAYNDDRS